MATFRFFSSFHRHSIARLLLFTLANQCSILILLVRTVAATAAAAAVGIGASDVGSNSCLLAFIILALSVALGNSDKLRPFPSLSSSLFTAGRCDNFCLRK